MSSTVDLETEAGLLEESVEPTEVTEMTNHSALMRGSFAQQGQTTQFATDDYRWQGEPIEPSVDAELFRKGQLVAAGKIRQVGPHGVLVETDAEFPENAYLQVRFTVLEDGQTVHHQPFGRVVSCSSHGVGLLMDVLEPVARDALQALLAHAKDNPMPTGTGCTKPHVRRH